MVVSDFRGPLDWRKPLLELMRRHDVLAVEIRDRREQELPDVGEVWLVDPETGRQVRVDTRSAALRERFAAAAAEERTGVARVLSALGVPHTVLSTSGDWLRAFAVFLSRSALGELRPSLVAARAPARAAGGALWRMLEHRRHAEGERFASAALLPTLVQRAPGRLRLIPRGAARARALRADRRHGAAARDAHGAAQRRDGRARDGRLALDEGEGRAAVAPVRGGRPGQPVPERDPEAVQRRARRVRQQRDRLRAADDRSQPRAAGTRAAAPRRGNRDRRRRSGRGATRQEAEGVDGVVPPTTELVISDGARDGGRVAPLTAAKRAKALGVPVSTVLVGTPDGIVTAKLIGGYTEQIRVPADPTTLRQIAQTSGGTFYRAPTSEALDGRLQEARHAPRSHDREQAGHGHLRGRRRSAPARRLGPLVLLVPAGDSVRRLLLVAAVASAALVAAGSAGAATHECNGFQTCVPVAGPWVLATGRAETQWQLACPKGYVVGGIDAELTTRALDVVFSRDAREPGQPRDQHLEDGRLPRQARGGQGSGGELPAAYRLRPRRGRRAARADRRPQGLSARPPDGAAGDHAQGGCGRDPPCHGRLPRRRAPRHLEPGDRLPLEAASLADRGARRARPAEDARQAGHGDDSR